MYAIQVAGDRSLVFCALGLYSLRLWSRLLYGALELVFGAIITLVAINAYAAAQSREYVPIVGGVFHTPPQGVLHLSGPSVALFGMLVAVYVLVRGLDNFGEGLRDYPKLNARWQTCFRRGAQPPDRRLGKIEGARCLRARLAHRVPIANRRGSGL